MPESAPFPRIVHIWGGKLLHCSSDKPRWVLAPPVPSTLLSLLLSSLASCHHFSLTSNITSLESPLPRDLPIEILPESFYSASNQTFPTDTCQNPKLPRYLLTWKEPSLPASILQGGSELVLFIHHAIPRTQKRRCGLSDEWMNEWLVL